MNKLSILYHFRIKNTLRLLTPVLLMIPVIACLWLITQQPSMPEPVVVSIERPAPVDINLTSGEMTARGAAFLVVAGFCSPLTVIILVVVLLAWLVDEWRGT